MQITNNIHQKDPDAVLDFSIDWTAWLNGDTITASTWDVPDGITEDSSSNDTTGTTIWLSGGTAGEIYELTNHVTTADGRENDATIKVMVNNQ